jgi:hypothetical protein
VSSTVTGARSHATRSRRANDHAHTVNRRTVSATCSTVRGPPNRRSGRLVLRAAQSIIRWSHRGVRPRLPVAVGTGKNRARVQPAPPGSMAIIELARHATTFAGSPSSSSRPRVPRCVAAPSRTGRSRPRAAGRQSARRVHPTSQGVREDAPAGRRQRARLKQPCLDRYGDAAPAVPPLPAAGGTPPGRAAPGARGLGVSLRGLSRGGG